MIVLTFTPYFGKRYGSLLLILFCLQEAVTFSKTEFWTSVIHFITEYTEPG